MKLGVLGSKQLETIKEARDRIKGLAQDRGWSFCSSLSIIHKGKMKVAFLCLFLRQLSHLSGIEQFYIDTFPCNITTKYGKKYLVVYFFYNSKIKKHKNKKIRNGI